MLKRYYKVNKFHKEIFKSEELCSYNELLFMVEAPKEISGIDIWRYTESVPLKECNDYPDISVKDSHYRLTKKEVSEYPYYEMFISMYSGNFISPLIFMKQDVGLVCIEGKHRMRIASLLAMTGLVMFKDFPAIIVEHCETREAPRYPEKYGEWINWIHENSWREKYKLAEQAFKELKWD